MLPLENAEHLPIVLKWQNPSPGKNQALFSCHIKQGMFFNLSAFYFYLSMFGFLKPCGDLKDGHLE